MTNTDTTDTIAALLALAGEWQERADRVRKYTSPYDGGCWDMKAEAYEMCSEELREHLSRLTDKETSDE